MSSQFEFTVQCLTLQFRIISVIEGFRLQRVHLVIRNEVFVGNGAHVNLTPIAFGRVTNREGILNIERYYSRGIDFHLN
jgi:hypothetical protein